MKRNIIFLLLLILPFSVNAQIYKVPIGTSGNSYLLSVKNYKSYTVKKLKAVIDFSSEWIVFENKQVIVDSIYVKSSKNIEFIFNVLDNVQIGDTGKAELKIVGQCGQVLARKTLLFIAEPDVKGFRLYDTYPNPTNSCLNIKYSLTEAAHVKILVFNILGKKVTTITDKDYSSGMWKLKWDGRDEKGKLVSTGVYLVSYKLSFTHRKEHFISKVLFVK